MWVRRRRVRRRRRIKRLRVRVGMEKVVEKRLRRRVRASITMVVRMSKRRMLSINIKPGILRHYRHDECARYVSILNESLPVRSLQCGGHLEGRGAGCLRYRHYNI